MSSQNFSGSSEFLTVTLNGFLLNAGVVGLLRAFAYARRHGSGCTEGEDYRIDGQSLHLSCKYLLETDLADLYVKSMVHWMGQGTRFVRTLEEKGRLDSLYADPKPSDRDWKKAVDDLFKNFTDTMERASFKSGFDILASCKPFESISSPTAEMVNALKKEKDYAIKKERYDELCRLLQGEKVREVLIFKDLMYTRLNLFMGGVSFFNTAKVKKDITETYRESFVTPLIEELGDGTNRSKRCIDCGALSRRQTSMSFLTDVADDTNRKRSYYWNCNPDAYLCPLCAFVYSFAPLGFLYYGRDGVFVNNNSDIPSLRGMMSTLEQAAQDEDSPLWYRLYNTFTSQKIKHLHERVHNIQVVIREADTARYSLSIIDRCVVSVLDRCESPLKAIRTIKIKDGERYIDVYQSAVENIVARRAQYPLITRLLRLALAGGSSAGYIFNLLQIQIHSIYSDGGEKMEENVNLKRANVAKRYGHSLRAKLTEGFSGEEKEDRLRGLVYQLLNAVSLGNRDSFLNLVLRTYSGLGMPVPDIFLSCFKSDDNFKDIGFAYLLGLKSDPFTKDGKDKTETNEEEKTA